MEDDEEVAVVGKGPCARARCQRRGRGCSVVRGSSGREGRSGLKKRLASERAPAVPAARSMGSSSCLPPPRPMERWWWCRAELASWAWGVRDCSSRAE